ncbi:copper resistance protein CopC [Herbiconiux sp. CPCC 205763]|uniref:Copper resistance protein CopC n=1 Tax=Herbiconiux aconitum TaxID=2970913 RepID=A0ABT2GPX5_9MICO|nr:copper resistance CopC family protein [Herbiconiux aconitum]MCS5717345.1 copper resistance protein CopC [Herbiconiux aconitum]
MTRPTGVRRAAITMLTLALVAGATIGGAESASAHDYLVSTNPVADSTVTETLSQVSLTFNEPPLADASAAIAIELHDPSGANVATGAVSIVNSTLSIDVAPTTPGAYTVLWQNVSADGHAVSGEFGFDYAGPAVGGGSSTPEPTTAAGSSATPEPAAAGTGAGGIQFPLVLIGIGSAVGVVVIVAAILLILLRRRSRPGP